MFAVQKEDRFYDPSDRTTTGGLLGPGTYNSGDYHAIKKAKPAPAGFGKSERVFDGADAASRATPAPGAYDRPSGDLVH